MRLCLVTVVLAMGKGQSKLTQEQLCGLVNTTHFSEAEVKQWFNAFAADCPTGALTRDEFAQIYDQFFPFGKSLSFAHFVFNVFDKNRDGIITFNEFIAALSVTSRGTVQEKLDWAFQLYDLNNDGQIDFDEMVKVVESIYLMVGGSTGDGDGDGEDSPTRKVQRIFSSMGKDGDIGDTSQNTLNRDEFRQGAMMEPTVLHALALYDGLV